MQVKKRQPSLVILLGFIAFAIVWYGLTSTQKPARQAGSEASYRLAFREDFKPQLASRDDMGISVVLAVDCSGSMSGPPKAGGSPKYEEASQALGKVVEVLGRLVESAPPGQVLKVGVLKFSSGVSELLPLTVMDKAGIQRLAGIVSDPGNFAPQGSTAIGEAVERAAEWLSQSGTILRSLIVVTDGQNMEGVEPSWTLSAIYNNRNSATTADFPVTTSSILVSFIGFDIDSGLFRPLEAYGARILSATDQSELSAALSSLLEADITKLEAPALEKVK